MTDYEYQIVSLDGSPTGDIHPQLPSEQTLAQWDYWCTCKTPHRVQRRPVDLWEDVDAQRDDWELRCMYRVVDGDGELWKVYDNVNSAIRVCGRLNGRLHRSYAPFKIQRRFYGEWEEIA